MGAVILHSTSFGFFKRAENIYSIYHYESIFVYIDVTGNVGKSEITAGKAITDSFETRNVVIRSDSQYKVYITKLLSENYTMDTERSITAMISDDEIEAVAKEIENSINTIKNKGVSLVGIDIKSESVKQIVEANLMVSNAKRPKSSNQLGLQEKKMITEAKDNKAETESNEKVGHSDKETNQEHRETKDCPMCAETVKYKAKICRFCNYKFE